MGNFDDIIQGELRGAERGAIRAERTPGGNITIDTTHTVGGLIRSLGGRPHIEIERADLEDVIAALQALRGPVDDSRCWGCSEPTPIEALDVAMRCAACRTKSGLPPTEAQAGYASVAVPPAALDAAERNPGIVRKIEEHNERLIAFLKERLPSSFAEPAAATGCPVPGGCDNPHCRPPAAGLAIQGRWRVYFNKHGRADLPWCIAPDAGGWELAVPTVEVTERLRTYPLDHTAKLVYDGGVILKAVYQPKATPDDEDGRPSAWIAVDGVLTVSGGRASIAATAAPEVQTP